MDINELANIYYEKQQQKQELGKEPQDTGDIVYCKIGELLAQIDDKELVRKLDLLILEMSDADRREYYIKGFEKGLRKGK